METPNLEIELALRTQGHRCIAGLDEAGRGAWAGPVVAAAVILPLDWPDLERALAGVRDSKQLSPAARDAHFEVIGQVGNPRILAAPRLVPPPRLAVLEDRLGLDLPVPDPVAAAGHVDARVAGVILDPQQQHDLAVLLGGPRVEDRGGGERNIGGRDDGVGAIGYSY